VNFYHKQFNELGRKPRELTASLGGEGKGFTLSGSEDKTRITITDKLFGPRGGIDIECRICLPVSEWEAIVNAYVAHRAGKS
jgi:hypothetical protein